MEFEIYRNVSDKGCFQKQRKHAVCIFTRNIRMYDWKELFITLFLLLQCVLLDKDGILLLVIKQTKAMTSAKCYQLPL